jgi:hypothetical protein
VTHGRRQHAAFGEFEREVFDHEPRTARDGEVSPL